MLLPQPDHKSSKVLIFGLNGTGKTTFWTRYLIGTPARYKFVYDHQGIFAHRTGVNPATDLRAIAGAVKTGWCIFDPCLMYPGDLAGGWEFFCNFVFNVSKELPGRKLIGCDELQMICETHKVEPDFASVLETGRNWGLDLALVAQQANQVHNRVRNQATEVVCFLQADDEALRYLKTRGFNPDEIMTLQYGQFICRSVTGGESRGYVFARC